ncbi:MAG: cytochrome c peroxidase [Planctomycetota bacterium]|jgi:cytochrome c peroxidase
MKHFSLQLLFMILVSGGLWGQITPSLATDTLPKRIATVLPKSIAVRQVVPKDSPILSPIIELGRRIFFDPVLSKDKTVACASCHRPESGFASNDPKAIGIGGKIGTRNSPTLFNRGFGGSSFWDGRVATLEEQVLEPISNPNELGHSVTDVLLAMGQDESYQSQFRSAFSTVKMPNKDAMKEMVTERNLSRAIATFVRSLVVADSPVDRFHRGDSGALTKIEKRGLWLFESRGGCWQCHSGFNFSDELFHNTGVALESKSSDEGRKKVTNKPRDLRAFKTPTLRGVAVTAPYMHDGSLKTLREVVEFYNRGGNTVDPVLDRRLRPLKLEPADVDALVALLKALSRNELNTSKDVKSQPQGK